MGNLGCVKRLSDLFERTAFSQRYSLATQHGSPRAIRLSILRFADRDLAYVQGLLSGYEGKNGRKLAESMCESAPNAVQHLLDRVCWDAHQAQDRARSYAIDEMGSEDAVLIADVTAS
jgi:hypothetical protein